MNFLLWYFQNSKVMPTTRFISTSAVFIARVMYSLQKSAQETGCHFLGQSWGCTYLNQVLLGYMEQGCDFSLESERSSWYRNPVWSVPTKQARYFIKTTHTEVGWYNVIWIDLPISSTYTKFQKWFISFSPPFIRDISFAHLYFIFLSI